MPPPDPEWADPESKTDQAPRRGGSGAAGINSCPAYRQNAARAIFGRTLLRGCHIGSNSPLLIERTIRHNSLPFHRLRRHCAAGTSVALDRLLRTPSDSTQPPETPERHLVAPKGDVWMGAKQLTYADEARQKLLTGVSKLARAVRSTLGPRGRNAVLDKGWGSPNVTKDGVTVAEEIELQDPYENMGAQLVKEAASKTSDVAGDGTTTATVLAEAIYREGLKMIAAGHDPMALVRGVQKAVEKVVEELQRSAEKIDAKDEKEITEVATIAANNNREIGAKLAEAMKLVGASNGVITIEEGKTAETEVVV